MCYPTPPATRVHLPSSSCLLLPAAETDGAFAKGSQWLVWKFESDSTLSDALEGSLGPWPQCLEGFMSLRTNGSTPTDKRDTMVSGCTGHGRETVVKVTGGRQWCVRGGSRPGLSGGHNGVCV